MNRKLLMTIGILFLFSMVFSEVTFVQAPKLQKNGNTWQVEFSLSEICDVAVAIVALKDSSVVRHLAAGVLGPKAPLPLTAGTLHQIITWDGKDDFGRLAAHPESLSVRVRAGMDVKLLNFVGEDLYLFSGGFGGITLGRDGSVFILGKAVVNHYLRRYDASGNYIQTIYPPSAGLPKDSVAGYDMNLLPGSGWAPKQVLYGFGEPSLTGSLAGMDNTALLPIGKPGELVLVNGSNRQTLSESGAMTGAGGGKILTGPAGPTGFNGPFGPKYFTASASPDYLYLSGWYYATTDGGGWVVNACTTGFWADGQVFKVNRATGVASPWIKLDSVPVSSADRMAKLGGGANAAAAIHGVALDDSGHVFVCDRLHKRISVYDTNAVLLGSVPCDNPDYVAVSKRTNAIYVITRLDIYYAGPMNLVKFSGWRNPAPAVATTLLTTSINAYTGAPCMVLTEDGNSTVIWTGYAKFGLRQYRDNGAGFTLVRDFSLGSSRIMYNRLTVDRSTETVYLPTGTLNVHKIEDWGNPVFAACSTSNRKLLRAADLAVGPDGFIYGRYGYDGPGFVGPILRYTADHLHAEAPYANTGKADATPDLLLEVGLGMKDKGVTVGWQGQIGLLTDRISRGNNILYGIHDANACIEFPDTGADTTFPGYVRVTGLGAFCGGIKYDPSGNVYLGSNARGSDFMATPGYELDWFFNNRSGSIVKYAPGATGSISGTTAFGAAKIYPQPYGTYAVTGTSSCPCRSPRFDVDPYGRLFIPNSATASVAVVDNEGNTILTFGQYGNTDSRGPLSGPGRILNGTTIPIAYPEAVAASEDYIYVNDWINARLLRVQMTYALDNLPGLTEGLSAPEAPGSTAEISMTASPNPFNPASVIRILMPRAGRALLKVYDLSGRLIRVLLDGDMTAGRNILVWRGDNDAGGKAPAGVYAYRLTAGKRTLILKTVLAK